MPNWKKIALSGSNPEFASLTVDNAIQAGTVSGSFSGSYVGDGSSLTGLSLPQVATVTDTFTSTTSKTVTHNFSTKNVIVQVYDNDDNIIIPQQVTTTDTNTVDITLDTSTTGRVVVAKGGHIVSGSVDFNSLSNTPTLLSSSAQIASDISGSFTAASSSISTRLTTAESELSNTLISSSAQIATDISGSFTATSASIASDIANISTDFADITNKPTLLSSSAQITGFGFISQSSDGAISSSAQIVALGANIVSSSAQIATDISGSFVATSASFATTIGSLTSDYTELTNIPGNIVSSSTQTVANLTNQNVDLGTGDITAVTASLDYVQVSDRLQGNGSGFQFFAYNEDTVKTKFANWYSSNDRQYGMGQLWFETWFAAIDNQAARDNRRIGFYLEEPDAGSTDSGTPGQHPSNSRFYVDINGAYLSGSLNATGAVTASAFVGDGSSLTGITAAGTLSSSAQIASDISGSLSATAIAALESGILSGSAQITSLTSYTETFTGSAAVTASHNLGTKNVNVQCYGSDDFQFFPSSIKTHDTNNVYVTFNSSRTGRIIITK